jgi:dTDP-4-dehydrorhamnose reductase
MRRDVLILGASGYIGQALTQALGQERVLGTRYAADIPELPVFDVRTGTYAQLKVQDNPPRVAIILFAESRIENCFSDREAAYAVNVTATIRLIDELMEAGVMPVFVSTDLVFDGEKGGYTELDRPEPILEYGRQKLAVEQHLENSKEPYLIVRLPKVVSAIASTRSVFGDWLDAMLQGREVICFDDQFFSPIDVDDAAAGIVGLIDHNHTGLFHICGPDRWSRADLFDALAREVCCHSDISPKMVRCSIRSFQDFSEVRPFDTSLKSSKSTEIFDLKFRSMEEVCADAVQRALGDRNRSVQLR